MESRVENNMENAFLRNMVSTKKLNSTYKKLFTSYSAIMMILLLGLVIWVTYTYLPNENVNNWNKSNNTSCYYNDNFNKIPLFICYNERGEFVMRFKKNGCVISWFNKEWDDFLTESSSILPNHRFELHNNLEESSGYDDR